MKIDIRVVNNAPAVHAITFADNDNMEDVCVRLQPDSVNIECRLDSVSLINVRNTDILNLINALKMACELKGIG